MKQNEEIMLGLSFNPSFESYSPIVLLFRAICGLWIWTSWTYHMPISSLSTINAYKTNPCTCKNKKRNCKNISTRNTGLPLVRYVLIWTSNSGIHKKVDPQPWNDWKYWFLLSISPFVLMATKVLSMRLKPSVNPESMGTSQCTRSGQEQYKNRIVLSWVKL